VTFKNAVNETPDLKDSWCAGFQAFLRADKDHVAAEDTRRVAGSVHVDAALKERFPEDNRWDYAVGHQPTNVKGEVVYWIEIHSANSGEVKVVLAKLEWLQRWLNDSAPKLKAMPRAFIWVSSGKTSFAQPAHQLRRLASLGLRHVGRGYKIPDETFL
jgi:hypothetical protein